VPTSLDAAALEVEAQVFARYLVGRPAPPDLVERYRTAAQVVWGQADEPGDAALLEFVRRHPWSVGPLDAATALLAPGGPLRGRILLMAAILEATPAFADDFLPRAVSIPTLSLRIATAGIVAVCQALAGILLQPIARRRRS